MPYTVVRLTQGTSEWHTWRDDGVGASDASSIMGENRFKSRSQLLDEKCGFASSDYSSAAMARGMQLEPQARRLFQQTTGLRAEPACLQSRVRPWLRASVDGLDVAAGRVVDNAKGARNDRFELPEADLADLREFVRQVQLLSSMFGLRVFEQVGPAKHPVPQPSAPLLGGPPNLSEDAGQVEQQGTPSGLPVVFTYSGNGFAATCFVSPSGDFVVRSGSRIREAEAPSLTPGSKWLREHLSENGVIKDLLFQQDYPFPSASAAAQTVSGTTINGRIAWTSSEGGKTYAAWEAAQLAAVVAPSPPAVDPAPT
jgi:putative phage-type endonuclease